jgi:hypothetical protein
MSTDLMPWGNDRFYMALLIGMSCIVSGSYWELVKDLPPIAFQAPRPPSPEAETASVISNALKNDSSFRLEDYFECGAGGCYQDSRLIRILSIAAELKGLQTLALFDQ